MALERQRAATEAPIPLWTKSKEIEIVIKHDTAKGVARLHLANPGPNSVAFEWRQMIRQELEDEHCLDPPVWHKLEVPPAHAGYLDTVFQGEQPWVRQLRVKHRAGGHKALGTAHVAPHDILKHSLRLVWERKA